jgi:hypothetical protein
MQQCRPDHNRQHCYHHAPKVKPEAATAIVELLMMGVRTPETCWAVNKRQDNKLEKLLHLSGDLLELYDDARTCRLYTCKWKWIVRFTAYPFTPQKRNPLTKLLGKSKSQFGRYREDNILFPLLGMKLRLIGHHQFRTIWFIISGMYNNGTCTRVMNDPDSYFNFLQFTEALTRLYILTLVTKLEAQLLFQEIYWCRNIKQLPQYDVHLLCFTTHRITSKRQMRFQIESFIQTQLSNANWQQKYT